MNTLALLPNLAGPDMIIIFLIVLIMFGAKKLPELAKGLGQAVREFSKAKDDVHSEFNRASQIPDAAHAHAPVVDPAHSVPAPAPVTHVVEATVVPAASAPAPVATGAAVDAAVHAAPVAAPVAPAAPVAAPTSQPHA